MSRDICSICCHWKVTIIGDLMNQHSVPSTVSLSLLDGTLISSGCKTDRIMCQKIPGADLGTCWSPRGCWAWGSVAVPAPCPHNI